MDMFAALDNIIDFTRHKPQDCLISERFHPHETDEEKKKKKPLIKDENLNPIRNKIALHKTIKHARHNG